MTLYKSCNLAQDKLTPVYLFCDVSHKELFLVLVKIRLLLRICRVRAPHFFLRSGRVYHVIKYVNRYLQLVDPVAALLFASQFIFFIHQVIVPAFNRPSRLYLSGHRTCT